MGVQEAVIRESSVHSRSEALQRVSVVARASLETLAGEPDLESFLGYTLAVCSEQLAAEGGEIWLADDGCSRVKLVVESGEVRTVQQTDHPGAIIGLQHEGRCP